MLSLATVGNGYLGIFKRKQGGGCDPSKDPPRYLDRRMQIWDSSTHRMKSLDITAMQSTTQNTQKGYKSASHRAKEDHHPHPTGGRAGGQTMTGGRVDGGQATLVHI